ALALKDRSQNAGAHGPRAAVREQVRELRRGRSRVGRETEPGEKIGGRHADVRVRGDELLLRFAQIGPALEQIGRKAGRYLRRQVLLLEHLAALDGPGRASQEEGQLVLLRRDLALD